MSDPIASLPPPTPLRRGMLFHYHWGEQQFEVVASAASVRTVFWDKVDREVTWLHCTAVPTKEIGSDGSGNMMTVLIPAEYVTRAEDGPTFRITHFRPTTAQFIFPPTHPRPGNAMPLEELQRVIGDLLDASLN